MAEKTTAKSESVPVTGTPATRPPPFYRRTWVVNRRVQYRLIAVAGSFSVGILILCYAAAAMALGRIQKAILNSGASESTFLVKLVQQEILNHYQVVLAGYVFMTGLFAFFMLRETNRVAGPIFNLTRRIRTARETGEFIPVTLRKGDCFQELAEEYNTFGKNLGRSEHPNH